MLGIEYNVIASIYWIFLMSFHQESYKDNTIDIRKENDCTKTYVSKLASRHVITNWDQSQRVRL